MLIVLLALIGFAYAQIPINRNQVLQIYQVAKPFLKSLTIPNDIKLSCKEIARQRGVNSVTKLDESRISGLQVPLACKEFLKQVHQSDFWQKLQSVEGLPEGYVVRDKLNRKFGDQMAALRVCSAGQIASA